MIVSLQTEHHMEFLSLKGGYRVYNYQNTTLLEISCTGSNSTDSGKKPLNMWVSS